MKIMNCKDKEFKVQKVIFEFSLNAFISLDSVTKKISSQKDSVG